MSAERQELRKPPVEKNQCQEHGPDTDRLDHGTEFTVTEDNRVDGPVDPDEDGNHGLFEPIRYHSDGYGMSRDTSGAGAPSCSVRAGTKPRMVHTHILAFNPQCA